MYLYLKKTPPQKTKNKKKKNHLRYCSSQEVDVSLSLSAVLHYMYLYLNLTLYTLNYTKEPHEFFLYCIEELNYHYMSQHISMAQVKRKFQWGKWDWIKIFTLNSIHPYPFFNFYGVGSTRLCWTATHHASLSCRSMPARPQLLTSVFTHSDHAFLGLPSFIVLGIGMFVIDLIQDGAHCMFCINSMDPAICDCNSRYVIFKLTVKPLI